MVLEATPEQMTLPRLMLRSLLEDGGFARANLRRFRAEWFGAVVEAVEAGRRDGDLGADGDAGELAMWLLHHLGFGLKVMALPRRAAVDYGVPRRRLTEQAVRFALRGFGLTEAAIRRYYRPERLDRLLR